MPTISELADKAGVSVMTVTRILGGDAGIDAETRERVLKLVRELEVTSDLSTAAVTDMPSQVIGVILDTSGHVDLHHPVFGDVLDGLKEVIAESGYDMLFFTGGTPSGSIRTYDYLERCRRHHVDVMILMGVGRSFPEIQALMGAARLNTIYTWDHRCRKQLLEALGGSWEGSAGRGAP